MGPDDGELEMMVVMIREVVGLMCDNDDGCMQVELMRRW